ncbi:MAG TPA: PA0069 family radical SAM protein [Methylococcaceae bacterium]|nr:PA0069 family radical SAM protein [Methylococcaceae bacterium]
MAELTGPRKGCAAVSNPDSRFSRLQRETLDDGWGNLEEGPQGRKTFIAEETAKTIISRNDSPDIPFEQSINAYRGCEHGCIYCYARPTHAYHNLSPGLDFETRLFAKHNAVELLRKELARRGYRPSVIALGANTDPYQPIERQRRLTRGILEVLAECGHPVNITTKSALIERDLDLLAPMAEEGLARVWISITTLDGTLASRLEPRAASPARRLQAVRALSDAGIPVGVMVAPVIPVLTDAELEKIVAAAVEHGACAANFLVLRLPREVGELFAEWLERFVPLQAAHVLSRVRELRGGELNDSRFAYRLAGQGIFADLLQQRFNLALKRHGLAIDLPPVEATRFRPPKGDERQLSLF